VVDPIASTKTEKALMTESGEAAPEGNLGLQSAVGRTRCREPDRSRRLPSLPFPAPGRMPARRHRQDACVTSLGGTQQHIIFILVKSKLGNLRHDSEAVSS